MSENNNSPAADVCGHEFSVYRFIAEHKNESSDQPWVTMTAEEAKHVDEIAKRHFEEDREEFHASGS